MVKQTINEKFVVRNQNIRDSLFKPVSKLLTKLNISANFLSNLKLIIFLPYLAFIAINPKLAFLFLFLSLLIDIFDGPLARFQKKQSDKGKFIDTFGDYVTYLLVIFSFIPFFNYLLTYHLVILPITVILSIIKNQEFTKTDWIIKPAPLLGHYNGLVYLSVFLLIFYQKNYLNLIIFLLNIYYTFLSIGYFIIIQSRWLNKNNTKKQQ